MSKNVTNLKNDVPAKTEPHGFYQEFEDRMQQLEKRFESLFPQSWSRPIHLDVPEWARSTFMDLKTPKVDIIDRDNDVLVKAEIPGVNKDDLDVSLTDTTVTIKGRTAKEEKQEEGDYFRSETMKGEFSRTLALPAQVKAAKAKTKFKNGVLTVIVPKHEHAKRHKVKVS
jgi:HSP20 family protein